MQLFFFFRFLGVVPKNGPKVEERGPKVKSDSKAGITEV